MAGQPDWSAVAALLELAVEPVYDEEWPAVTSSKQASILTRNHA